MSERHDAEQEALDHLALFLQFADTVQAAWERAHRPVYAETCACGGSVEVGREATPAERRRIQAAFYGRHRECPDRLRAPLNRPCACGSPDTTSLKPGEVVTHTADAYWIGDAEGGE